MSIEIAKAGYVQRLSSVMRRWKQCYLAIYVDGTLRCFDSENAHIAKHTAHMKKCSQIDFNLTELTPPDNYTNECLFKISFTTGYQYTFSTANKEDCEIWIMALKESLTSVNVRRPPPPGTREVLTSNLRPGFQPVYQPGQQLYDQYGNPVQNQVIYVDGGQARRRYRRNNTAMNVATGALVGTMVMSPLLWW